MDYCKIGSIYEVKLYCRAFLDHEHGSYWEWNSFTMRAVFMVLEVHKEPNSCKILWKDMAVWLCWLCWLCWLGTSQDDFMAYEFERLFKEIE